MTKILIVDDELSVREMLVSMIASDECEITALSNATDALAACKTLVPDLIITDIVMPGKNGIDLIMTLKKEHPELPIIAISGGGGIAGRYDYLEIAKLVGANNIIKKPFSMKDMRSAVSNILENNETV